MIIGQTMYSVRKGTEHRAERALQELAGLVQQAGGHYGHRVLRSFGMSPLASALHNEGREAVLGDVHFVFETEWESMEEHDQFYSGDDVRKHLRLPAISAHHRSVRGAVRHARRAASA